MSGDGEHLPSGQRGRDVRRSTRSWFTDAVILALIAAAFVATRAPLMFRTYAAMDEECYAIPGITVYRHGIPQIPYMPSRDRDSVFWQADKVLFAEPPLVFYLQAITVALFGENLGGVRMASTAMGLISLVLLYRLCVEWFDSRRAGLLAAFALSLSRGFYFPAMTARPDMAAITFCLAAMLVMSRQAKRTSIKNSAALLTGGFIGLSLLTHPIGLAGLCQQTLWVFWQGRRQFAWIRPMTMMGIGCVAGVAPLLLLIVSHREEFVVQFGNNIFKPGSDNLGASLLNPFAMASFQIGHYLRQLTIWQGTLLAVCGGLAAFTAPSAGRNHYRYCLLSTPFFVSLALGNHPVWGYYVFYVAVFCGGMGRLADVVIARFESATSPRTHGTVINWRSAVAVVAIAAVLLPGAGLRTTVAHLRNWNNANYNADAFVDRVLRDIPLDAQLLVHEELIVHVWLRRPSAVLGIVIPRYFDVTKHDAPIEYALLRPNDEKQTAEQIGGLVSQRTYGDPSDIFSMKTELFRKSD